MMHLATMICYNNRLRRLLATTQRSFDFDVTSAKARIRNSHIGVTHARRRRIICCPH